MRIKILSDNNERFNTIRLAVLDQDSSAEVSGGVWHIEELPAFIDGSGPDVLIVDGATADGLPALEALGQRRPDLEVVLISEEASADFLMRAMRAGVREVIPTSAAPGSLQEAIGRVQLKRTKMLNTRSDGKVLSFLSCKGGSGATFIAANLAYALAAEQGKRVALIDLNLQFGDAAMFVSDQRPPSNIAEVCREIRRLDASLLRAAILEVTPEFHVLAAPDDPSHASDVKAEHVESIIRLACRNYDFVVVDVARSLDALSLQALDMSDMIFMVVQLTLPFIRDSKRLFNIFHSLDYPSSRIRLVVNRYVKGGEITLTDLERTVGQKVFKSVPNSYMAAASSVNLGIPIIKGHRADSISKAMIELAQELTQKAAVKSERGGWLSHIFS